MLGFYSKKKLSITATTIRLLGDHTSVLLNAAAGPRGHAPLHHLVDQVPAAPEEAEPLIAYLISKGASPDLADTQGKTVLDRAIEQNQERLVIQLIQLGAGRTLNLKAAQNYFRTRPHLRRCSPLYLLKFSDTRKHWEERENSTKIAPYF